MPQQYAALNYEEQKSREQYTTSIITITKIMIIIITIEKVETLTICIGLLTVDHYIQGA